MKIKRIISVLLCIAAAFAFGCSEKAPEGLWKDAVYTSDAEAGEGEKTFTVEIIAGEKSVKITVHTDETTVGDALLKNGIIDGEEGQFGLYVKKVNGITADFDADGSWWGFYINGEMAMTGVDGAEIDPSAAYKLSYEK